MIPPGDRAWRSLVADVESCERCPRLRAYCREVAATRRRAYRDQAYWGRPVPGFGDRTARLLLVGLAPGAHGSNRTGRMFTGDASGDFLFAALHRAGLASQPASSSRDDGLTLRGVYITAVARCAPPHNRPLPAEIEACRPFLLREIALLPDLRAILALGAVAWSGVRSALRERGMDVREQPRFRHGARWRLEPGAPLVVASYHPSRQNTQTGRLTPAMFDSAIKAAWRACL